MWLSHHDTMAMASFVPVFGLHPQLSPEEKHVQAGTHLGISSHSQAASVSDCWERSQGISKKFLPARLRGDGDWNCDGFI